MASKTPEETTPEFDQSLNLPEIEQDPSLANLTTPNSKPDYLGHRARLRERFNKGGAEALSDHELLELLLFPILPRRDTKPIAKALHAKFGSLAEVLAAPANLLHEVKGLGETSITDLKVVFAAAQRMTKENVVNRPILSSSDALLQFCRTHMAFEQKEQFRILFLDKKNKLIADEVQQQGTVDHTPVYPREVIKRTLELSASAIILVHNHPSGDPQPSPADIRMTQEIIKIAHPLGIDVHDHLIIGKNGHVSMRAQKIMG